MSTGDSEASHGSAIPALPPGYVPRARLLDKLSEGVRHPLTLVTGPPGSGKTVLVSGWARETAGPLPIWISLDSDDNDPSWFRRHLAEAAGSARPPLVGEAVDLLGRRGKASSERRRSATSVVTEPVVFVFDDFHVLTTSEVIETISSLARALSPRVPLVICSRRDPRLAFGSFPGHPELQQIDGADLRFTEAETSELFGASNPALLEPDVLAALTVRNDGWAAGLRLIALMAAERNDPITLPAGISGSAPLVSEYFQHEVMTGLPPDHARFLTDTSVLPELTAGACEAVTGRADAAELLEHLRGQEVFLTRASIGPSYRCLPLFRDFLLQTLRSETPGGAREAHRKAAGWFQDHDDAAAAVHHLAQSGEPEAAFALAAPIIAARLERRDLLDGEMSALAAVGEEVASSDPARAYVLAAACLCDWKPRDAAHWLRTMDRVARDGPRSELFRARAELLWTVRDWLLMDADGVLLHVERAGRRLGSPRYSETGLAEPDSPAWLPALDHVLWRRLPVFASEAHIWRREPQEAKSILAALPSDANTGDPIVLGLLARVAHAEGRLDEAYELARPATIQAADSHPPGALSGLGSVLALAAVHFERDELASCSELLEAADRSCGHPRQWQWKVAVGCDRAQVMLAEGRALDALTLLGGFRDEELDGHFPVHRLPDQIRETVDTLEIRCRLALGDLEGAIRTLHYLAVESRPVATLARIDLAAGRPDRAAARLVEEGSRVTHPRAEIERLLLLARAHLHQGDDRRAEDAFGRALDRGRPQRFVRVFLDNALELTYSSIALTGRFPDAYLSELASHSSRFSARQQLSTVADVLEPLTERERELLTHLQSHLSQHEIAKVMYISPNTVKTHTKAVYRKLGAGSRSEAVQLARQHGLI